MEPDRITILTAAKSKRATKLHRPDESLDYDCGYRFNAWETSEFTTLTELHAILQRLERSTRSFVIRGQMVDSIREEVDGQAGFAARSVMPVRRLLYDDMERGDRASFCEADHRWLCLDLDHVPTDHDLPPLDTLDDWIRSIIMRVCPMWVAQSDVIYQWSASTGSRSWRSIGLHVWVMLSRPVCSSSLREWFKAAALEHVDTALYSPVQVHYTAAPIFDGVYDTCPRRLGMLTGHYRVAYPPDEIVDLATMDRRRSEERQRIEAHLATRRHHAAQRGDVAEYRRGCYAQGCLRGAVRDILSSSEGERHATLRRKAYWLGGMVSAGYLDESDVRDVLTAAGETRHDKPSRRSDVGRVVEDMITRGRALPVDLSHIGGDDFTSRSK